MKLQSNINSLHKNSSPVCPCHKTHQSFKVYILYQFLSHSKYNALHQLLNMLSFLLLLFIMVYFLMMSES